MLADFYNEKKIENTSWDWLLYYLMIFPDFNISRALYVMCHRIKVSTSKNTFSDYLYGSVKEPGLLISLTYYIAFFIFESVSVNEPNNIIFEYYFRILL